MFLTNTQGLIPGSPEPPDLDRGFPTWGSILNSPQFRYNTYWWGKWHLSGNDATTPDYAEQYGFTTGGLPCPSPNGNPGQGLGVDPLINLVFQKWLNDLNKQSGPWCTTVSLVNPHDIAWYPKYTSGRLGNPPQPGEDNPPSIFHELPANFERWPEALDTQNKPGLQNTFRLLLDELIGVMPANPVTPGENELWYQLLDLYVQVTHYVDQQIGAVLQALANIGADKNTIIIFTSDQDDVTLSDDLPIHVRGLWGGLVLLGKTVINTALNTAGNAANPK
jgi:arylsulfatase A-like enzyme